MIKAMRFPVLWYGLSALIITVPLLLLWPGWLKNLFSSEGFLPHLYCYLEKPGLVLLHVVSDSLIGFAYVAISATLTYLVYRARRDIPFHWILLAFGLFIVACGATHFMEVWTTLWTPVYWLAGNIKMITAIASVATAVVLPPLVPKTLALVQAAKVSEERRLKLETTNKELAELYRKLKELDQLKTQFFANVSHELRTPLRLVLGPTQRLLESDRLTTDERQNLETIDRNARLLLKHVNDLLDLSKIEAGKMTADVVETDLALLVRLTAAHFELFAKEQQIAYVVETPESVPARIDPEKTQRILLNLLSNAFKFTSTGGKVRCLLRTEEGRVLLSVQDSGPGIRPELRQAIFEPFRQGEGAARRWFGGTGLGPSIAKEFVALHGGQITVGDAPIGGARFDVNLPLFAPPTEAGAAPTEIPSPLPQTFIDLETGRRNPERGREQSTPVAAASTLGDEGTATTAPLVLVVEDNAEVNRFITESLTPHYRVVNAFYGREGLEKALAGKPDLILSDIMMPEMSGDQMIREIRAHPELDAVPIIVLTAKADDELSVRMLHQGAQEYLIKPFPVKALRARVGNLIALKQARELLQQEVATQNQDLVMLANEIVLHKRVLQQKTAEAEEANRLKTQFLSNVSHELRTPLHAIIGYTSLALDGTYGPFDPALRPAMEGVIRNAGSLLLLVDDLLDLTRIEAGKLPIEPSALDIIALLRETASGIQPLLEEKGLVLRWRLADPTPNIESDGMRAKQILTNLLANAVKFTRHEGEITLGTEDHPERGGIVIWIQDTGIGIPEEELPKIFDAFHQVDGASTREFGGVGLGLAIVKELVGLLQGKIQVESRVGKGSTFTLFLPYHLEGKR